MKNTLKKIIPYVMSTVFVCMICAYLPAAEAQTTPPKAAKTEKAETDSVKAENPLEFTRPQLEYESGGKRDPFESLAPEVEEEGQKLKGQFNYEGAVLNGIVDTGNDMYALVTDKDGLGYVLREGYRVFGGYVTDITADAIAFHIVKYGRSMTIIMRFSTSKSTVVEEIGAGESFMQKPGIAIQYKKTGAGAVEEPKVLIEDVVLPSLDTKTVDKTWFGGDGSEENTGDDGNEASEQTSLRFSLIDPPSGSLVTIPYVFDWSSLAGDGWTYRLIIDEDADFSSPLFDKDGMDTSSCVIGEHEALPSNVTLYWKVLAKNASGETAQCRRTDMSFTIR